MSVLIRTLRVEEFDDFMRYVERAFGLSKGFFQRQYPHMYQATEEACSWGYVVEENGKIVSHVGLYPIEVVTAGVRLRVGGIGAVSTAHDARGKGHMTALLRHVVEEMRRLDYPISWLGGDRQRYSTFGWELAGLMYKLTFSRRSMGRYSVEPAPIEEMLPSEIVETVQRFELHPACHPIRLHLAQQLQKADLRLWAAADGYAIAVGQAFHQARVVELVSTSGNELGLLRAVLNRCTVDRVTWDLSAWDEARLGRVMPATSRWELGNNEMYRINDLAALLTAARPTLEPRAAALRNFAVAVALQEHDRLSVTTIAVEDGEVVILPGRHSDLCIELSVVEAARLFLGGPAIQDIARVPAGLRALLPAPVYVGELEHV